MAECWESWTTEDRGLALFFECFVVEFKGVLGEGSIEAQSRGKTSVVVYSYQLRVILVSHVEDYSPGQTKVEQWLGLQTLNCFPLRYARPGGGERSS
jgi:hypothetical protein